MQTGSAFPPELHAARADPCDDAQALGLRVEDLMPDEAAYEFRDFNVPHVQINQPVALMAERLFEKMFNLGEQRGAVKTVQKRNQILILNSAAGNFFADLPEGNSPLSQEHSLVIANVFVQKIHATTSGLRRWLLNFP